MALANVLALGVGDVRHCVKVDDTAPGIAEGLRAGMWTVGLAASGNAVGLTAEEWAALTAAQQDEYRRPATAMLREAGAHYVVDTLSRPARRTGQPSKPAWPSRRTAMKQQAFWLQQALATAEPAGAGERCKASCRPMCALSVAALPGCGPPS